ALVYDDLLKKRSQRKLNAQEQQRLRELFAAAPELKARWAEDVAIPQIIQKLPQPEISSNFTSQVLRKIEFDQRARAPAITAPLWRRFWPRTVAYSSLAFALCVGAVYYQQLAARTELAENAATVTTVARLVQPQIPRMAIPTDLPPMPPVDIWVNFEAIRRLPDELDTELMLALE
ncbi:MAG: hypothetical protein V4691_06020, partial [Pseudomonadota bacterium]